MLSRRVAALLAEVALKRDLSVAETVTIVNETSMSRGSLPLRMSHESTTAWKGYFPWVDSQNHCCVKEDAGLDGNPLYLHGDSISHSRLSLNKVIRRKEVVIDGYCLHIWFPGSIRLAALSNGVQGLLFDVASNYGPL